jgi:RNA polymerase sigma-70 factor, ECF subfamily
MKRSIVAAVSSLFSMTDEQAMWRVRMHDDPHAFAQLVQRWEKPIQRLCCRMLGDAHKGEDAAQEAFSRLFAKRKDYETTGRFSTFLWRIALNLCYDELRRVKRRPEAPLEIESLETDGAIPQFTVVEPPPDALLLRQEESQIVQEAVAQLSDAYRSVVILRHYEDLKFREIADVLGIPEGTVKSRMAEALTQLHKLLSRTFGTQKETECKTRRTEERLVL